MGRRWFDIGEGPWGDNPPFHVPVFVVTHTARAMVSKGETTFTFVTDGVESALRQAKGAAGKKNITVGGANTAQQLLGDGRRLFEDTGTEAIDLKTSRVIEGPGVTHLRFRVTKKGS